MSHFDLQAKDLSCLSKLKISKIYKMVKIPDCNLDWQKEKDEFVDMN